MLGVDDREQEKWGVSFSELVDLPNGVRFA